MEQFKGCKFSGGKPQAGDDVATASPDTTYITFVQKNDDTKEDSLGDAWVNGDNSPGVDVSTTDYGEVSGCEFLRSSGFKGRAIAVERLNLDNDAPNLGNGRKLRPKGTLVEYNVFGGSDPSSDGYFVNAINDGGENTVIRHNTIRRFVDVRAASSDKATVDAAKADQAHGIHSEGAVGSEYLGNVIAGWMPEAAGGAFKLDGSQRIQLFDNWMATSGILMYSDMNTRNPNPLRDIYIRSNKIYLDHTNISPSHSYDLSAIGEGQRGTSAVAIESGDIYRGIGIWIKDPLTYDNAPGAKLPDDLSGYSPPGAGTSIRIESTEVWGPHGLIYFKAHPYADTSAIAEPSDLYSGSGGVFDSIACEIDQQGQLDPAMPVQNSISLYKEDFATDCAIPNPIITCPEPPSLPPPPPGSPPVQRAPAQCIVDPKDGANVCRPDSLPPPSPTPLPIHSFHTTRARHPTPRHASPRHPTPRHATPRQHTPQPYLPPLPPSPSRPRPVSLPSPYRRQVCISLPPGQDVNDDTDVVAQAWVQRVLKIDHATRYRLPLAGVYGVN